ncbi:MAG: pyridoxal-phosphate dependent enzyme [Desulfobacteraceae bacterium]|nr:MAG: pyridoxal-phosphate dependent enzyme [Desulfobacteraceae bacterium]
MPLHVRTPIWESEPLSSALGVSVLLKMEAFQPTGSFKIRGIGHACQVSCEAGATRLVCSSGGNAGYAVAYAGRKLGTGVTVVVPRTTPNWTREMIRQQGATVIEHGESWDDSHAYASVLARQDGTAYIHPFDDPLIWRGHASIVEEIAHDGLKPDTIVLSVGGGGLLCGVLEGMHRVGWTKIPIIAVETEGAASFAASVEAGRLVTLDKIASVATTLGARTVASETLSWTHKHTITPWKVSDHEAVDACIRFADDHRILVEPACGAALSATYHRASPLAGQKRIMVIVCGGAGVSLSLLREWEGITKSL